MGLTRDQILSADDLPRKKIYIPEWKDHVWIKTLSAKERDIWEAMCVEIGKCLSEGGDMSKYSSLSVKATLAFHSLCDEDGKRLFTDPKDIDRLNQKSGSALDKIAEEAEAFNEISEKDIEELEKNLEGIQANSSK